jgi:hypothetical protein
MLRPKSGWAVRRKNNYFEFLQRQVYTARDSRVILYMNLTF